MTASPEHTLLRPSAGKALLIDGKRAADALLADLATQTAVLVAEGVQPGLAVILVGDDPASQVYVRSKGKAAKACGLHSVQHDLPSTANEADLLALIDRLNADPTIHGILVQLPLPPAIDQTRVLERVSPLKDVDGFHPVNVGLLGIGDLARALVPCTPAGCMHLLDATATAVGMTLAGKNAVVIGRSTIVGKPVAQLLLARNTTVTIAHSKTADLPERLLQADIVVAAIGQPEAVRGTWLKPGAIVIDVGINRVAVERDGERKTRLVGDVAFDEAVGHVGAITPVPGGVGPMTIAMLMGNTIRAARRIAAG